ncbi:hypothetical protein PCE1_001923 [Barthelona sp. PCE]
MTSPSREFFRTHIMGPRKSERTFRDLEKIQKEDDAIVSKISVDRSVCAITPSAMDSDLLRTPNPAPKLRITPSLSNDIPTFDSPKGVKE